MHCEKHARHGDITIAKFKDNMLGPDCEDYFIKVSCLKVNNAYCGDK